MKRIIALFCVLIITGAVCAACNNKPGEKDQAEPTHTEAAAAPTQTSAATRAVEATAAPVTQAALADPATAQLSELVKNARETVIVQNGGTEKRCRIPEILLDSSDAKAANSGIIEKYGEIFDAPDQHSYILALDYQAYLYDKFLSVYINCRVDGGNSDGLCFCFDITTGKLLDSKTLCSMLGRDYSTVLDKLKANLTSYYDEKFSMLQDNDEMRSQTLADSNLDSSKMFLNEDHQLTAMVNVFAAVGGGRWVETISAE